MVLEGKEFDKSFGEYGKVTVDVNQELKLEIAVGVQVDLLGEIKKLAAKTETPIDDQVVAWIEKLLQASKKA